MHKQIVHSIEPLNSIDERKGELTMTIAEQVRQSQDEKEMTRKAIRILENLGENADDLRMEFLETYGEEV